MDLHPSFNNKCVSLCNLAQASAVPLSRRLTEISSSFISGEQEDPCEFLVLLLDHLMQCLSSADSSSFVEYMSSPLHSIFGIHIKSLIKCTRCLNETITQNYESLLSIPIISHSNLESALGAFCSEIKLDGDNSIECQKCKSKVAALQSVQFLNVSPVIFINLKRFAYDQNSNITRKLTHFVSYPELLDLMPYIDRHVFESNQDNHQLDKLIYQLCGVLIHCGDTTNNGHIYSYIRSPNDAWYTANDETILPTNLKDVLTSNNSYLLCYVKLSEEKINLSLTEVNSFNTYPANILFSSTPIRPRETAKEMINTYSPVKNPFSIKPF
jgi:ubiquitin C-terminal hydrolase